MDWKDRLKKEYAELKERHDRLRRVKNRYDAGFVDDEVFKHESMWVLQRQLDAMTEYLHWLEVRLEKHDIEY